MPAEAELRRAGSNGESYSIEYTRSAFWPFSDTTVRPIFSRS